MEMMTTFHSEIYADLLRLAEELVDLISRDENGEIIGGHYVGGNGGLISRQTNMKSDELRRAIYRVKRAENQEQTCGRDTTSII